MAVMPLLFHVKSPLPSVDVWLPNQAQRKAGVHGSTGRVRLLPGLLQDFLLHDKRAAAAVSHRGSGQGDRQVVERFDRLLVDAFPLFVQVVSGQLHTIAAHGQPQRCRRAFGSGTSGAAGNGLGDGIVRSRIRCTFGLPYLDAFQVVVRGG